MVPSRSRAFVALSTLLLLGCSASRADVQPPADSPLDSEPSDSEDVHTAKVGKPTGLSYPDSARVDHVDAYHGVEVADPYRWLEALDSDQTRAWIEAQNQVTFGYLEQVGARKAIKDRLEAVWNYERWGVPERHGGVYVVSRNDGLQDQSVLYRMTALDAEPELLLDPNTLSEDGTVALSGYRFTPRGDKMAYGLSQSGSDWEVWRVRDVKTGKDTQDEIRWVKFAEPAWSRDGKGFYYARYDEPRAGNELEQINEGQRVFYHRLGTAQSEDELVYEAPEHPEWGYSLQVTDDGRYLLLGVRVGTDPKRNVLYKDLRAKNPEIIELLGGFEASYHFVDNDGSTFWFETDAGAPRGKLVAVDLKKPKKRRDVIAEATQTLRSVDRVGDRFFARYLDDAHARVDVMTLAGKKVETIDLPGIGSVEGFMGQRGYDETFYRFEGFATPETIYRYDIAAKTSEVFRAPQVAFDPSDFETRQVFVTSVDGTKVPMFISHKKGVEPNGKLPVYLYGYGGFNIAITPSFSVPNLVWMEMGGVYAVANLRGGGEFGEAWHRAGTKLDKQNVFDDFISSAQWLIDHGWTSPDRLAIGGRSNGGLLVGAAMTQRPELFGAALPGVGVMDMLRFNKFTIGWAWESDYGSPENPEEFSALRAYSPYHNLEPGTRYPATLVYTADHDDRVVPAHSFKFAAALQHAHTGDTPVLIRIDTKSGHGAGKPTTKLIEEWTDLWGFLVDNLGMDVASGFGASQGSDDVRER